MLPSKNKFIKGISRVHLISLSCNPLPPVNYGGIETIVTNLANGLNAEKIPVLCYCPSPMKIKSSIHVETVRRPSNPNVNKMVSWANSVEHIDNIARMLEKFYQNGDIVHFHHGDHYTELAKRLKAIDNYNLIETAHWRYIGLKHNVVFPSKSFAKEMKFEGKVISHGIDFSHFQNIIRTIDQSDYIFYAGRLTPDKGVHLAVEAAQELNIELRIAGPIMDQEYADGILPKVNYIGNLSLKDLAVQYSNAKAMIYMSQYTEPFGLTPVEAMYCGCPVITTGKGGTGETVIDGKTGFFAQTVDDIVNALHQINSIDRKDCVERAKYFSIERMTQDYLDYYEALYG